MTEVGAIQELLGRAGDRSAAFFRGQQSNQNVALHARRRLDLGVLNDFTEQARHFGATHFLVSHFAAAMKNHGAHFVAFTEKPYDLVLTNLKIVFRGSWTKLHLFQLRTTAALALFVRLFVLLILEFAVIGNLANRRIGRRRNFHQIQPPFARQAHRFKRLHDTQLPAFFVNHPDFPSAYPFVDADTVGLPEIPLCDKSPLEKEVPGRTEGHPV
jgi:hypothetical protein